MYNLILVEYLNALPFARALHAVRDSLEFNILSGNPRECAEKLSQGIADIALLPVGALADFDQLYPVSDFCIGCDGPVRTVCVFSHIPFSQISSISEDQESRSSNLLLHTLNEHFWKVRQEIKIRPYDQESDGKLIIGDRAFEAEKSYAYKLDLGLEWKNLTGLPFAFAIWVSRKKLPRDVQAFMNERFKNFLDRPDFYKDLDYHDSGVADLETYFRKNISYVLDKEKIEAIKLLYRLNHKNLPISW